MKKTGPCLGIIAGNGQLVSDLIQACLTQKRPYFILAIEGQTDPDMVTSHPHGWSFFAKVGHSLALLKKAGVTEIVMAGAMKRPTLSQLKVDFTGAKWMAGLIGRSSLGDDALLRYIAENLEKEGFKVISAEDVLGTQIFAPQGCLTSILPCDQALRDIERGKNVLKTLSHEDVGQAIVIQEGLILGIEAIEGTDALIERCGTYARPQSTKPVLIKMCKKGQDLRMDRPTIGPKTAEKLIKAGFSGMAYEAEGVILLEKSSLITLMEDKGLFLYGISSC